TSTHPQLPGGVFHRHPVLPPRRNFFQHAIAPLRWRFEQPCPSVLPPQISPFSFPIREPPHPLFQYAPRARRFVSAFRLSPHHPGKPVAARYLVPFARASQTSLAVAPLPASPTLAQRHRRLLQCDAFPLRWLLLSRYGTARSRPSIRRA